MNISRTSDGAFDHGVAGDFLQRRDHRVRVLGELHRAGVSQIFTPPRQREADDDGERVSDAR
jgi:hypothetical protein